MIYKQICINFLSYKLKKSSRRKFYIHFTIFETSFIGKTLRGYFSKEEEKDMFEDFQSAMAITKKMESILKEIDYLENQQWFKN